jgi:hypothetical protein
VVQNDSMALARLPICDTRLFFRPLAEEHVALLRSLPSAAWGRPTVAGTWRVRDVVAHLTDTALRRLSFQRDGHPPPAPPAEADARGFVAFINHLNGTWVHAAQRLSPRVLATLYAQASAELADFVEHLPLHAPPLFPVSWAGVDADCGWLDIGRDFTEQWHHQMQIRDAVGAGPLDRPHWLKAVLDVSMRALPVTYRPVPAADRDAVVFAVTGDGGGVWTLRFEDGEWRLWEGEPDDDVRARIELPTDSAWRLLFNALPRDAAVPDLRVRGDARFADPLRATRAVIV